MSESAVTSKGCLCRQPELIKPYAVCQHCRDRNKARRDAKKAAGVCDRCGKNPVVPERRSCRDCLKKQNKGALARTAKRRAKKLCATCGKPAKRYRCYGCRKAHNSGNSVRVNKARVRRAVGLCTKCGDEAPIPGRAMGPNCAEERRERYQKSEKGKSREKNRARYAAWRANRIALGLCIGCKDGKTIDGRRKCEECRENANAKARIAAASRQRVAQAEAEKLRREQKYERQRVRRNQLSLSAAAGSSEDD